MSHTITGSGVPLYCVHRESDGKIYKYGITTRFSINDKKNLIDCLIQVVRDRANPQVREYGIRGLEVIRNDAGTQPNYQNIDGLFADDILCEICDIISEVDDDEVINTAINHIAEQMRDLITTNGWCSSGRVGRLIQCYMILRDYRDGVYLSPEQRRK